MSAGIKNFVSEKQLDEKRKQRQEEWDRVRKPEDPVQAPEEEYDPRSLYERLQEQRDKKQEEFEEKLKFKNQFRGINDEESDFLQEVSKRTMDIEKKQRDEEKRELEEYREAVSQSRELPNLQSIDTNEDEEKDNGPSPKKVRTAKKNQQQDILKGAVKRKQQPTKGSGTDPIPEKKSKGNEAESSKANTGEPKTAAAVGTTSTAVKGTIIYPSATKCVGVLPGLGAYSNSDDSDNDDSSSDESEVTNNLLSRIVHNAS